MDPATTKFLNARPYAVLPVSPTLAALYTTHSPFSESKSHWCSKCGSYLMNGGSHVRLVRLKSRKGQPSRRALRTVCQSCQHKTDVTVENKKTAINVVPPNNLASLPSSSTSPSIPPSQLSTPPSGQESSGQGKARNKKKSGLQLLLQKNREKEMQERKSNPMSGGLAAFLSGL